ncbi:MAG: hypothetical protein K2N65_01140 [Anaeroplasmataceae bacterium]|nr:hypothetical protein [Anaeroplasmataceae bacterium]
MKKIITKLLLFVSIICGIFTLSSCKSEVKVTENDEQTQNYIKQEYLNFYWSDREEYKLEDVNIDYFLGIYDNAYVGQFSCHTLFAAAEWTEDIGGINFVYPNSQNILVYKNHKFYNLKYAYVCGILTLDNIKEIHRDFKKRYGR